MGFLAGVTLCRYRERPIELEPFQVAFLSERSSFRWVTKSRQVGFSFVMALEALARCHLRSGHTSVFISFNLDEAKDRILLARQVFEDLPRAFQKRLVVDSKTELVFESPGARKPPSRIVSVPSKAPRGKTGDVYIDELAHLLNDRDVFTGCTPLVTRSEAQLTGCSTPLGRRGIFWEIASEEVRPYPQYTRQVVPWWMCRSFCTDPLAAVAEADALTTEQMLERFGLPSIASQYESLERDDFEQEFCAKFVDESYSYFPYDLILVNTSDEVTLAADVSDVPVPTGRFVAGFDVGRLRDYSELALFEQQGDRFVCRMLKSFVGVPFAQQEAELRRLLEVLRIQRLSIDHSGIGMNLAENLARDFPEVVSETFTNESKERWATDFKLLLQQRRVDLPKDRALVAQIHSIKKRLLPSGKPSFESERTSKGGNADRFWAVVLARQPEHRAAPKVPTITARILGEDGPGRELQPTEDGKHPWEGNTPSDEPVWRPVGHIDVWPFS